MAMGLAHMVAGRYEAAVPWANQALHENAGTPALRIKLALCGHLGRGEEGDEILRRLRALLHSEPTIATSRGEWPKFFSSELAASYVEGLRKAGVSEE
jgi:adenylate cyclase